MKRKKKLIALKFLRTKNRKHKRGERREIVFLILKTNSIYIYIYISLQIEEIERDINIIKTPRMLQPLK